jgi:thiol-disulfide isomerase/thioredoxin
MHPVEPYSTPTRIPHLPDGSIWINTPSNAGIQDLRGRVLLFDIWDYTCINCLRTLPYLREWHQRYEQFDLLIIGVHTPEFPFAKDPANVRRAVQRLGIRWPIVLDNDQSIWTSFTNRYWPTKYLADPKGYLRYRHAGEGSYPQFEAAIQELLRETQPDIELPKIMPPVRPSDEPGAVCLPTTPELQADSLGNLIEGYVPGSVLDFTLPDGIQPGKFYLEGTWEAAPHGHRLRGQNGRILMEYEAARCNAVMGAASDVKSSGDPITVVIEQDGGPLPPERFGTDVLQSQEQTLVRVDFPRLYTFVDQPVVQRHRLSLEVKAPGLIFYAFSFESCASVQKSPQSTVEV